MSKFDAHQIHVKCFHITVICKAIKCYGGEKESIHTHCLGFFFDVVYIGKAFNMEILHNKSTQIVLLIFFFCQNDEGLGLTR